jgi:pilus assembly protein CpaC
VNTNKEDYPMSSFKLRVTVRFAALVGLALALAGPVRAAESIRVAVGHAVVVPSDGEIRTVVIAEPNIADAAVGSERTVVVTAKSPGSTNLIIYNENGRYTSIEVEVYAPSTRKQVLLHVTVAEVNETAKKELGLDITGAGNNNTRWLDGSLQGGLFPAKITNPSVPVGLGQNTDGILNYNKNNGNLSLQVAWKALEQKGDIRTLANPTLVARSGEKASFLAGGEFPVPIAQGGSAVGTSTGGTLSSASSVTIQWKEFGVRVEFTPTVLDDNTVSLTVAPEVSALDFTNPLEISGFKVPVINSRKTSTSVDVRSGEHLVIGGLKQTDKSRTVRKVPVLGDIPLLGLLFKSTTTQTQDRELLVIVSPEIVASSMQELPPLPTDRPERK